MDCRTVETEDLRELAAEIRTIHRRVHGWDDRNRRKDRRLMELLDALTAFFGVTRPPERELVAGSLRHAKDQAIRAALWASGGSKAGAARILRVNVKTVYNLMRELGIPLCFGKRRSILGNDPSPSIRA